MMIILRACVDVDLWARILNQAKETDWNESLIVYGQHDLDCMRETASRTSGLRRLGRETQHVVNPSLDHGQGLEKLPAYP